MVGNGSFVPGPFLVGFWGHESGHVYWRPNIIFKALEPRCRLPCQTSAKNISLNSFAKCANMVQTLCQDVVALYVSPCCADIECNRSKKGRFFLQETMPCIHGPSLCVYACKQSPSSGRRALSGACFWGLKSKHFWLRGCGPSL